VVRSAFPPHVDHRISSEYSSRKSGSEIPRGRGCECCFGVWWTCCFGALGCPSGGPIGNINWVHHPLRVVFASRNCFLCHSAGLRASCRMKRRNLYSNPSVVLFQRVVKEIHSLEEGSTYLETRQDPAPKGLVMCTGQTRPGPSIKTVPNGVLCNFD